MSIKEFWSITGDTTKDSLLLLPFGVLVVATMWAVPGTHKATPASYAVIGLDICFLLGLVATWVRHLMKVAGYRDE